MTRPAKKENEMKPKNGEWLVYPSPSESVAGITTIYTGHDGSGNMVGQIAEIYGSDKDAQAIAKLMASAPAMLELLKDILAEVRPEISRVNEEAGQTIFNPVATETIDMAKELIARAEGRGLLVE